MSGASEVPQAARAADAVWAALTSSSRWEERAFSHLTRLVRSLESEVAWGRVNDDPSDPEVKAWAAADAILKGVLDAMGEVGEKVESWMEPQLWYFNQPKGVLNAIQTRISWNLDMKSLVERWQKESKIESTMTTKWLLRALDEACLQPHPNSSRVLTIWPSTPLLWFFFTHLASLTWHFYASNRHEEQHSSKRPASSTSFRTFLTRSVLPSTTSRVVSTSVYKSWREANLSNSTLHNERDLSRMKVSHTSGKNSNWSFSSFFRPQATTSFRRSFF